MNIEPDTKDWTWVLERRCPECGFDASSFDIARLPDLLLENAECWREVFAAGDVSVRPAAHVWSPLEYACHVRDAHELFDQRVALMLDQDDPVFANWDQDAVAVEQGYAEQDPDTVLAELVEAAASAARRYAGVEGDQWARPGTRSNGSVFTVESLGRYHLHDVVHHLYDVGS